MTGTGLIGILENFGGGEIIVIVLFALVFLGPDRLPEMARGAGRMLNKFKDMTEGIQGQVQDIMDDPTMQPLRELGEIAARPRQKLTEYALEAEAEARAKKERETQDSADAMAAATPDPGTPGAESDPGGDESASGEVTEFPIDTVVPGSGTDRHGHRRRTDREPGAGARQDQHHRDRRGHPPRGRGEAAPTHDGDRERPGATPSRMPTASRQGPGRPNRRASQLNRTLPEW